MTYNVHLIYKAWNPDNTTLARVYDIVVAGPKY